MSNRHVKDTIARVTKDIANKTKILESLRLSRTSINEAIDRTSLEIADLRATCDALKSIE